MRVALLIALLVAFAAPAAAEHLESGLHHAVAADDKGAPSDWRSCLPDGVSKDQVRNAVQALLKTYPQYRDVAIATLVARLDAWLAAHPEYRDAAVSALLAKAQAWLAKHPEYNDVPAAILMARDLAEGLPCE